MWGPRIQKESKNVSRCKECGDLLSQKEIKESDNDYWLCSRCAR